MRYSQMNEQCVFPLFPPIIPVMCNSHDMIIVKWLTINMDNGQQWLAAFQCAFSAMTMTMTMTDYD